MAEVTAHTITLPVNNTLPEAQVIQQVEDALAEPPEGRAKLRGRLVTSAYEDSDHYYVSSVNWGQLSVNGRRVPLPLDGNYSDDVVDQYLQDLRAK